MEIVKILIINWIENSRLNIDYKFLGIFIKIIFENKNFIITIIY